MPLPKGAHRTIAALLRRVFPEADWDRAHDYHVAAGILREHRVRVPDSLRGDAL